MNPICRGLLTREIVVMSAASVSSTRVNVVVPASSARRTGVDVFLARCIAGAAVESEGASNHVALIASSMLLQAGMPARRIQGLASAKLSVPAKFPIF